MAEPVLASPSRCASTMSTSISASASSGSLKPSPPKTLMPLSAIGIVAGADHDAGVRAHAHGEMGDRGGGNGPAKQHPSSHRADARGDRGLDHVAGEPRVLADDDPRGVALAASRHVGHGAAEREGHLGGDGGLVGHAPNPVGSEENAFVLSHGRDREPPSALRHSSALHHSDSLARFGSPCARLQHSCCPFSFPCAHHAGTPRRVSSRARSDPVSPDDSSTATGALSRPSRVTVT